MGRRAPKATTIAQAWVNQSRCDGRLRVNNARPATTKFTAVLGAMRFGNLSCTSASLEANNQVSTLGGQTATKVASFVRPKPTTTSASVFVNQMVVKERWARRERASAAPER